MCVITILEKFSFFNIIEKKPCGTGTNWVNVLSSRGHSLVVKHYPSKLDMRVRFPLPAPQHHNSIINLPPKTNTNTMKTSLKFALLSVIFGTTAAIANDVKSEVDCTVITTSVQNEVTTNASLVLSIVEKFVKANPQCACEIVKTSIASSKADAKTVASIVEVAAVAAPDQMRLVAQCALAIAPDALNDVQAVMAKLDPATGDSGSSGKEVAEKGGMEKGGIDKPAPATAGNPLDFPTNGGGNVVGPTPGGPGGYPLLPPYFPYQVFVSAGNATKSKRPLYSPGNGNPLPTIND